MKTKKIILLSIISIILLVFLNGIYFVFFGQHKAAKKLMTGEDLTLYECISTYIMHIGVWMFGWPQSPECARECMLLHVPQKDTVYFHNFNLSTPKINAALAELRNEPCGTSKRVTWYGNKEYAFQNPEHRAAIAVNPCVITKKAHLDYQHFEDEDVYELSSPMWYPKQSRTEFHIGKLCIVIQEGLFRHLQDRNWLSHYIAVYKLYI